MLYQSMKTTAAGRAIQTIALELVSLTTAISNNDSNNNSMIKWLSSMTGSAQRRKRSQRRGAEERQHSIQLLLSTKACACAIHRLEIPPERCHYTSRQTSIYALSWAATIRHALDRYSNANGGGDGDNKQAFFSMQKSIITRMGEPWRTFGTTTVCRH
jgi:hypothetical protein